MIKSILCSITSPMKMENTELGFRELTMLVGANNTGKSFLLVNCWCLSLIVSGYGRAPMLLDWAQFIYDRSFANQNIHGVVRANFDGYYVEVTFDKGKVTSVNSDIEDQTPTPMQYMSSPMRTFEAISMYLKLRKRAVGTEEEILDQMSLDFKLYDVMYIEHLIKKCPITVKEDAFSNFNGFNHKILAIDIDLQKCDFLAVTDNGTEYLTTFSKGDQSLINMIIANL